MKKIYQFPINKVVELDIESTLLQASNGSLYNPSDSNATGTSGGSITEAGGGSGLSRDNSNLWDSEW